jgi:outer membrane protein OmpA-like peptidoglycan-associated protein
MPTGDAYVVALAVSWETSTGTSPDSTAPIKMTITDTSVKAGDIVYALDSSGIVAVGTATVDGSVTLTFSSDPIFAAAAKLVAQATLSAASTPGTVGTGDALTSNGGSGTGTVSYIATNGTATGCTITNGNLTASSAGTCLVTAIKASDGTFAAATSAATSVAFVMPARPGALSVNFTGASSALSTAGRQALVALAKKLLAGASVTITGYAGGNKQLATARAKSVTQFLVTLVQVHTTLVGSKAGFNKVVVSTSRQ